MKTQSLLALLRNVTIKSIKKGEILIEQGAEKKDIFFIRKGLIRAYHIFEDGHEKTFQLFPEYHVLSNAHSVLYNEPSKFSYQAIEPTKVYSIDYNSFLEMTAKNPKLLEISRTHIGQKALKQSYNRVESFVLLSPEERYRKYMQDYPTVINRAPDKYIANVLGITPVSLSRIKGRITAKK